MAPICGLCEGEMADLDFHLEGKCQAAIIEACVKDPGFSQAEVWNAVSETFGTEACNHRCHLSEIGAADGNLRIAFQHPRHCITCDGSRPIKMNRAELPQTKSCACGCGMEISTLGTTLTVHDYTHWIVRNFDVSCSAQYLGDSQKPQAYKVTYSPDAVMTFRDIPWNLADEAASPIKDINWSIDANFPPVKSWACKRGHNYRGVEMKWAVMGAEGKTATSGPICPLCVVDFLNREFPAVEVKDG